LANIEFVFHFGRVIPTERLGASIEKGTSIDSGRNLLDGISTQLLRVAPFNVRKTVYTG
jgi:hypothetical protein